MKAVLMSIKPKWCELIASGEKTVEVRKTKPRLGTPFKVYIYCTKDEPLYHSGEKFYMKEAGEFGNGKVIGEFVCGFVDEYLYGYCTHPEIGMDYDCGDNWWEIADEDLEKACLTYEEFKKYVWGRTTAYGWHISNLIIYDNPRGLSEFYKVGYRETRDGVHGWTTEEEKSWKIKRPPQSWCYVEE